MRFFLLLIVILAAAGFFTRPDAAAHLKTANALFAMGKADTRGSAIDARTSKLDDFYVVTRSTIAVGDKPLLECWGAFTRFLCVQPGAAAAPAKPS
jgi:hypothetical protein